MPVCHFNERFFIIERGFDPIFEIDHVFQKVKIESTLF